jgi:hypothetical protein
VLSGGIDQQLGQQLNSLLARIVVHRHEPWRQKLELGSLTQSPRAGGGANSRLVEANARCDARSEQASTRGT